MHNIYLPLEMVMGIWRIKRSGGTPTKGIIPKYGRRIPYTYNSNRMKQYLFLMTTCVSGKLVLPPAPVQLDTPDP
jgi:hypothetical protein